MKPKEMERKVMQPIANQKRGGEQQGISEEMPQFNNSNHEVFSEPQNRQD